MPLKSAMDNMSLVSGVHKVSWSVSLCIETYSCKIFPQMFLDATMENIVSEMRPLLMKILILLVTLVELRCV
jgi:hypothetical protein